MWNINDNIAYIYIARQANNIFKITKKCHFDLTAYTYNFPNVYYVLRKLLAFWWKWHNLKQKYCRVLVVVLEPVISAELTMKATSVSDTACPLLAHSCAISRMMFLITLSAWALDILKKKFQFWKYKFICYNKICTFSDMKPIVKTKFHHYLGIVVHY